MVRRRRGIARAADQARNLARDVRLGRSLMSLSRDEAARRAGVSRSTWDRVERGSSNISLFTLTAVTDAVGLDFVARAYPGREPSLRDSGQLVFAMALARMASSRWQMELEVPAGEHGEAIDQVFSGPTEVLAVEIERRLADGQAQYRRWRLKREWLQARTDRPVRLVVVVEDAQRNRTSIAPHTSLFASVLPLGTRAALAALRSGEPLGGDGLAWMRRPR
jgi:transcriptional regulator with XRE-family HTH domain